VIENGTYSGCIPNMRAEKRRVMTPKKKETFSRVRTTLADCHETESLAIRVDIWDIEIWTWLGTAEAYLELEVLDFTFKILCKQISRQVLYFEGLFSLELNPVSLFLQFVLQFALEKIDMGVKIGLDGVWSGVSSFLVDRGARTKEGEGTGPVRELVADKTLDWGGEQGSGGRGRP